MTIRVGDILDVTAEQFGVPVIDLVSDRRGRDVVRARHVAGYLAKRLTPHSMNAVARMLNKDHTTVGHGLKIVEDAIREDAAFAAMVERLADRLRERERILATYGPGVIDHARAIARATDGVPRRQAMAATTQEIEAMAIALCSLWDVASAAEVLIGDLGHCEVLAPQADKDRLARIEALSAAILDEINHIAGPATPDETQKEDMKWKL